MGIGRHYLHFFCIGRLALYVLHDGGTVNRLISVKVRRCGMDEIERHRMAVREFIAKAPFGKTGLTDDQLDLFCSALTHDSYTDEAHKLPVPRNVESYERLEFLGDAVVELTACEHIYLRTDLREGPMTDFKQEIVANRKMSERILSYGLGLDQVLLVGHGHRSGKDNVIEENMRADSFEALIGAVYLVYGLKEAERIVTEILIDRMQ